MWKKLVVIIGGLVAALAVAVPAQMQETVWTAYLYHSADNVLVRADEGGETQELALPLPTGSFVSARELSFSPDGSRVAFCALTPAAVGSNAQLIVYEVASGQAVAQEDLGAAMACRVVFSDNGARMALALLVTDGTDWTSARWQIAALDPATGETLRVLTSAEMPEGSEPWEGALSLPIVRAFNGSEITFAVYPYGTEGPGVVPAFRWSIADGSIAPVEGWGALFSDYLSATGELAYAVEDPALPMGNPGGPMPSSNVVRVQSADGSLRTVYTSGADWVISGLAFVDGGRSLAIQLLQSFDFEQPDMRQVTRWIVLDRQGGVADVPFAADYLEVVGASDGYAVLQGINLAGQGAPELALTRVSSVSEAQLWTDAPEFPGLAWELAWTTPMIAVPDLPPFPAV